MNLPLEKSRIGTTSSIAPLLAAFMLSLVSIGCRGASPRQPAESAIAEGPPPRAESAMAQGPPQRAESAIARGPADQPAWVRQLIAKFQSEPVSNPPHQIVQFRYRSQRVYYVPPECCDQMSTLYDSTGAKICSPDGGMTGKGDGRCIDFFTAREEQKLIWKDSRTWPPPKSN
jgi:hypothetical protein